MNFMNGGPLGMALRMMQMGRNPMTMLQQMASRNPRMNQGLQMIQGKNGRQLRQMAENMARERGTSLEAVAQSMGIQLPQ